LINENNILVNSIKLCKWKQVLILKKTMIMIMTKRDSDETFSLPKETLRKDPYEKRYYEKGSYE
jgi:hypothetical protein